MNNNPRPLSPLSTKRATSTAQTLKSCILLCLYQTLGSISNIGHQVIDDDS